MAANDIMNLCTPDPAPLGHDPSAALAALDIIFQDRPRQVVALGPASGHESSATFQPSDADGLIAWLSGPAASANVYFAHAERHPYATTRRKTDLVAAHWLHVDLDPRKGQGVETERARMRALLASPPAGVPEPSLVVDSGRGYQALWRLEEPCTDLVGVEARNRWLIEQLGGDVAVFDVSRILRLPGTVNFKPAAEGRRAAVVKHRDGDHAFESFGATGAAVREPAGFEPVFPLDTAVALAAAGAYLATAVPAIEGQGGRTRAFEVGARLKRMGLSPELAQSLAVEIYDPRCEPPDAEWMRERISSGWEQGAGRPGCDHPASEFAGVMIALPPASQHLRAAAGLKWADDANADQPIEWLLKGILPRNGVGIIYGAPKSGKSFVAFDLAARLACHLPWFGIRTPKDRVGALMLLGEGGGTVATRLQAFSQATGAKVGPMAWLTVSGLTTAAGLEAVRRDIRLAAEGMSKRGVRLALIVVDTLASALGLEDENSAPEVTRALKALEQIASEFDAAIVGIHHAGKNGQDRGSSAFRAACDVMMAVERGETVAGQPEHRRLSVVLNRNGEGDWSTNFKLDRVVLGKDDDGDEITSCTVSAAGVGIVTLGRRETVMALFDPVIIHLHGNLLPAGGWAIPKNYLRQHCFAAWGDELSKETRRKTFNRNLAELLTAGRLVTMHDAGVECLAAIPDQAFEGISLPMRGQDSSINRNKVRDTAGQGTAEAAQTQ